MKTIQQLTMNKLTINKAVRIIAACCIIVGTSTQSYAQLKPEGMLLQLRHDQNYPLIEQTGWPRMFGGDIGMPAGQGFTFTLLPKQKITLSPGQKPALPSGIVFWFKHSINNKGDAIYLKHDPSAGDVLPSDAFPSLQVASPSGVDMGAKSGEGFYWYETTGTNFNHTNLESAIMQLPRGTVICLKNTVNQPSKTLDTNQWGTDKSGRPFDPVASWISESASPNEDGFSPRHFKARFGGDVGANAKTGFYWYEKIDGFVPEMADLIPVLTPTISSDSRKVIWNLTITNAGKALADEPFTVSMEVENSANPQFPSGKVFTVLTKIGAGGSYTILNPITTDFITCTGAHKYWVVINVDSGHQVIESDESNNLFDDRNYCIDP